MSKFKVGDKVKMISTNPYYNFGDVETGDIGEIIEITGQKMNNSFKCYVDFPSQSDWTALEPELELIEDAQSIHVTTKGNEIIAVLKNGKEIVKIAKAKCSPSDMFSFEFGAKLAVERLFGEDKPIVREVKRKAKVGEWVKVTHTIYRTICIDDILQVSLEEPRGIKLKNEYGAALFFFNSEYVVLENYTPPKHTMMDALFGKSEPKTLSDYTNKELLEELLRREK